MLANEPQKHLDFQILSRPLKTIYDDLHHFRDTGIPQPNDFKLFAPINKRYFLLAVKSGIFMEITEHARQQLFQYQADGEPFAIDVPVRMQLISLAKLGVFSENKLKASSTYVEKMNLNLCHKCNLICKYCFAEGGGYGYSESVMPEETAQKALEVFISQIPENCEGNIILFGGEPLLNKKLMYFIIDYGRALSRKYGNQIIFDIFTNGTLIDEGIAELMNSGKDIRILLSLDGPPEINNQYRFGRGKLQVSTQVEKRVKLIEHYLSDRVVLRCTVADVEHNLIDRIKYFVSLGFRNIVFDPAFGDNLPGIPPTDQIYQSILEQLPAVTDYLVELIDTKGNVNINMISEMLTQILKNSRKAEFYETPPCPAGSSYISVDTSGAVYPCHFFVGKEAFSIGRVNEGIQQIDILKDNGIRNLEKQNDSLCKDCDLNVLCEGPCPYKRLVLFPSELIVQKSHCRLMEERVVQSLRLLSNYYPKGQLPYRELWDVLIRAVENKAVAQS
ncbi:radical SAM/SPASM domain-containing protein [Paenibacillus camerounensis]|uniref:radical SAM/SPASM domain-containing protein n=1 Tax=Paenibacillus camerounensis TaxID=1243663 RepID=UPI0005A899EF|nr:radical SAM protein [Paenibacillus camerounensis]